MEKRNVKIEYTNGGPDHWELLLSFNTTREGVVQAFDFAARLEQRMILSNQPADCRITVTAELLGYADTRFAAHGTDLSGLLEAAWPYGFATG